MFVLIELNKNRFCTGFALFRRDCRSAQMNEMRIDVFLYQILPVPFRIHLICKENNVYKNMIK